MFRTPVSNGKLLCYSTWLTEASFGLNSLYLFFLNLESRQAVKM